MARRAVVAGLALAALVLPAGPARAQGEGPFFVGPFTVSPLLALREMGVDTNVFNTDGDEKRDFYLIFAPQVDAAVTGGTVNLGLQAIGEFLYFNRYETERAANGRFLGTLSFPFRLFEPGVSAQYDRVKERSNSEIDVRAPRTDQRYTLSLRRQITPSVGVQVIGGVGRSEYDRGTEFRGAELATQLNRRTVDVTAQLAVAVTPLTTIRLDVQGGRDEFVLQDDTGTDNLRTSVSLLFDPDAALQGTASFGYRKMIPFGNSPQFAFEGVTAAVDVAYVLLGRTRFDVQVTRDANYSVELQEPYYVSRLVGLSLQHNLVGPLDVTVRGSREVLDYESSQARVLSARVDTLTIFGGGLSVRVGTGLTVGVNYDDSKRRSTGGDAFRFARRRIYTTVTYAF